MLDAFKSKSARVKRFLLTVFFMFPPYCPRHSLISIMSTLICTRLTHTRHLLHSLPTLSNGLKPTTNLVTNSLSSQTLKRSKRWKESRKISSGSDHRKLASAKLQLLLTLNRAKPYTNMFDEKYGLNIILISIKLVNFYFNS